MKQINKVLIANRGEIAVRIYRTLKRMGIDTVAVYSEEDADALHTKNADERYPLTGKTLAETYLNIDQIIDIALANSVEAIHPGYGFLSENPDFAKAVKEAGLLFVGPGDQAIRTMGNKNKARELAVSLAIPVAAGATGKPEELMSGAQKIGFPVMVKAAAGGGGKGMHIAGSFDMLAEILERAGREAKSYFGDSELYIEKYLHDPRHVEIQLLADHHGNIVSLFERECSLQRRHQKIIEEAPAPTLSHRLRNNLRDAACRLAREIGYHNAGTVEFLVHGDSFYFLEMNTRIQVEHPATEMITGIDIVKEQMLIAMGHPLRFRQEDIKQLGHAIEARIYAEDPAKGFLPSPGTVILHDYPKGSGLRVDTGLASEGIISAAYDPLVSKIISHASDRETARKKLCHQLKNYVLLGVQSNISFLIDLLQSSDFADGNIHTGTVERLAERAGTNQKNSIDKHLLAMAYVFANPANQGKMNNPWLDMGAWRLLPAVALLIDDTPFHCKYRYHHANLASIGIRETERSYRLLESDKHSMRIDVDGQVHTLYFHTVDGEIIFQYKGKTTRIRPVRHLGRETLKEINKNPVLEGENIVKAPMQGTVIKINVTTGQKVNKGDTLLILESMKMENKISATAKAYVKKINVNQGEVVADNSPLVHLTDTPE